MKLQKLTIHNIASIEDAIIDFEAEPLADSEVFLITGKTGAGKSTILDAICLALYAKTPRMENTKMKGDIPEEKQSLKIDDTRQLLRRNTAEGWASLAFTGSNDVHYEATWSVARAHRKVNGKIQNKVWQLKNLDKEETLTKENEIRAEIQRAIGLDFAQFCRTVMLAQGDFTIFLNSKDDDKAEILEKITGVDAYSKIGAKVYEITGKKEQDWKDAKTKVEGISTLTDEEIEERKGQLDELNAQYNELKVKSDRDKAKRDWLKTNEQMTQQANDAEAALQKANEVVQSESFKEKEALVSEWNSTIDARHWLSEIETSKHDKQKQEKVLTTLHEDFTDLLCGQRYEKEAAQQIADELEKVDTFLKQEADKSAVYAQSQTIAGLLRTVGNGRQTITNIQKEIEKKNKTLSEELLPKLTKAEEAAKAVKETFEQEEIRVKEQEKETEALNLPKLRGERDAAKELLGNIKTAKERMDSLEEAKAILEEKRKSLTEHQRAVKEMKEKASTMDSPLHDAKQQMDLRKEVLDKQSDSINKFAKTLRQKLHEGDTCPVCGQKIVGTLPHEDELAKLVEELKDDYDKAENEYNRLTDEKNKLDAQISAETNACEREAKALENDNSVTTAQQKAVEACKACGVDKWDDSVRPALDSLKQKTDESLRALNDKIMAGEKQEATTKQLRNALETRRKEMEQKEAEMQKVEKEVDDCKSDISTDNTLMDSKQKEVDDAVAKVESLVTAGSWATDWHQAPIDFATALVKAAQEYDRQEKRKQTLTTQQQTSETNRTNVAAVITTILSDMPEWKSIEAPSARKTDNLLGKANSVANKVTAALTQLKSANQKNKEYTAKLDTFVAQNASLTVERISQLATYSAEDISREDANLKRDRDAVVAKRTLLENAKTQMKDHQAKRPELTEEDTPEQLAERLDNYDRQQTELGERRGAINQELKTNEDNRKRIGELKKDIDRKEEEYKKWSRMNQLIGDATGNKFRKIAQSYVLASLIHSANSYMRTLTDRYTLEVEPGTFVIMLIDAYQGFVSRAASTISGGESFLVSLSLALALSDIGQTLSVDTLFIDEGFGTLSGEPLQHAIDTLRSLHSKSGRHVGIISHVEELRDRIPVQIQVNQEGHNSSSTIRIVPEQEEA
jgi:exonuclease SbcC